MVKEAKKPPVSSYREVKIGKTLYRVTSVFNGEKELGGTLEKLAAQHIINEISEDTATVSSPPSSPPSLLAV